MKATKVRKNPFPLIFFIAGTTIGAFGWWHNSPAALICCYSLLLLALVSILWK